MKYDLTIIGAGPAGLSAAVNGASEGLNVLLCDSATRFGGQAGTSSLIENFLGFPEGISGDELTKRAIKQAHKFNVEFCAPFNANKLVRRDNMWIIQNDDEEEVITKSVLLAMGVNYRKHDAVNLSRYLGAGVSYGSPSLSESYSGKTICIIGGANSAGQAAIYLSACPDCHVKLIIRGSSIEDKMSTYLINKIENRPNIEVLTSTEVIEAKGSNELESIVIIKSGMTEEIPVDRLFILIGAKAKTSWVKGVAHLDENGFIITGTGELNLRSMETVPGIFAAGDIRASSVKRVANAVGEGARAINEIHNYLAEIKSHELVTM